MKRWAQLNYELEIKETKTDLINKLRRGTTKGNRKFTTSKN